VSVNKQNYLILIVDDEPANVYLLSRMLRDSYRIIEARSGEEALAIAHGQDKPALILLDVMMPEIDGFEVCRRLKADDETKDIIVIFVTAIGDSAAEEVGLNLGAADYITKPISLPIVRARVRNQINMRLKADMLEAMSYIDGLTHVYNRRKFDTLLYSEWNRAKNSHRPLALIMIDFDHFKALNDHYGHGAGDICLQQGAAALSGVLKRQSDLLARYGGEEFVALLPHTDLDGARMTAESMREAVKALGLKHQYSSAADHVTVSLGVAAIVPEEHHQATYLLELADRALSRAKAAGRDQVVLMDSTMPGEFHADALPAPEPSEDALSGAHATLDAISRPLALERRRYEPQQQHKQPQLEAVLTALSDLYRLPLSTELQLELDHLFSAASALAERLNREADHPIEGVCFDLDELLRRMGDDREIAAATVEQFLVDAPTRLQELREALEQRDLESLRFKAHSLKGLAGAVSAPELQRLAEQLEKQAPTLAVAAGLVERIEQEYQCLEPRLYEEFSHEMGGEMGRKPS
jgi:diguanylate cyclase (GGDEF)-like protein